MRNDTDKAAAKPSQILTVLLWLISIALIGFGVLGLIGANARAAATTAGFVVGYTVIAAGLLISLWAHKRRHKKDKPLAGWDSAAADDPGFTWDGDPDSPEALEAAFRGADVTCLPDGTMPGPIPPHVAGSLPLTADSLGGFLRSYPSNRGGIVRGLIMATVLAALAAACIELPHQKPPQPGEERLIFAVFYGLAMLCGLMGLGVLWKTLTSPRRTFHLFEDGFVEVSRRNSKAVSFAQVERCTEVSEFKLLTLHRIQMFWFELTEKGGKIEIDADSTRNAAELGQFIQARVFDRLLPQTVEAINAGLKLSWGPVTLDSHGISFSPRTTYRWDRIRGLKVARLSGSVIVNAGRFPKRTGVRADTIPNYPLLFQVSERMCSGA